MRGRMQASAVAMLGYIIPMLTPLVVALVTLRRGASEGTILLLISLVPALISIAVSESSPLLIWITLVSLIVVYVPALVLRLSVSLPYALLAVILISVLISAFALNYAGDRIVDAFSVLMQGLSEQQADERFADVMSSKASISGMITYMLAINGIGGLLWGRWMQALLYNPGGFGSEFRELRLGVLFAVLCFFGSVYCRLQGIEYWWWSNALALPLILVALAIVHNVVKARGWSTPWLVLCYLAVFIFGPFVMLLGFLDTWLNFRSRLQKK